MQAIVNEIYLCLGYLIPDKCTVCFSAGESVFARKQSESHFNWKTLGICVCLCVGGRGERERVGDMERKARWRKPRQNTSTLSSLRTPPLSFHQGVPKRQGCWIRKDVCVSLCVNVCLRMCVELVSEFRCLSTPGLHRDETSSTISLSPPWLFQTTHAMHRKMQTWQHTPFQPPTLI